MFKATNGMPNVHIKVDYRETSLLGQLRTLKDANTSHEIVIESTNLEVADVLIECDVIRLAFERKTLSDLASSIKDGRYKEQKYRMLSTFQPKHVTYLIEAPGPFVAGSGLSKSVFMGSYVHSQYRDGVHVMFLPSTADMARWILAVAEKCHANPDKFCSPVGEEYIDSRRAKTRRIENMDYANCYIMQLCQTPGISHKIAKEIADRYPNMCSLITSLQPLSPLEAVQKLQSIPMIGAKKAKIIYDYLFHTPHEDDT